MNTLLDQELTAIFEADAFTLEQASAIKGPLPQAYFSRLLQMIDRSGGVEKLKKWDQAERKFAGGRRAKVSQRAVLVAFLLNAHWGNGFSYQELAHTVAHRLSPLQRDQLGVTGDGKTADDWYYSARRAAKRLMRLIDPWHLSNLYRRKTGAEYERAAKGYDTDRERRAHELAADLLRASNEMLPKKFLESYQGDIAIDSTFLRVRGMLNPASPDANGLQRDRFNVDYQCGWYTRSKENHDGTKTRKAKPGFELDTTVLASAQEGAYEFPLISGIAMHRPGVLTEGGPRHVLNQHAASTEKRGLVIADRAFNNLDPEHFQEPLRRLRFEAVYDYRKNQLGRQGSVPGEPVILVDGVFYVDRMPEKYVMITRWYAQKSINPDTGLPFTKEERNEILPLREPYRMKAHGRIKADGYQRFKYPNRAYLAIDPVSGKPTKDIPTGTVMVGLAKESIKHLQKYPWKSPEWKNAYGQRNQVETSNKNFKGHRFSNIGDRAARTGRGYAYTYLCATMAAVAENLRRIITGVTNVIKGEDRPTSPKLRARRRRDSLGQRLPRITGYAVGRNTRDKVPDPVLE